jgi:hypothetical protein
MERDPVSEMLCPLVFFRILKGWTESKNPVISSAMYYYRLQNKLRLKKCYCHNHLESREHSAAIPALELTDGLAVRNTFKLWLQLSTGWLATRFRNL